MYVCFRPGKREVLAIGQGCEERGNRHAWKPYGVRKGLISVFVLAGIAALALPEPQAP